MYRRGNSFSSIQGTHRALPIGVELQGRPGAPARATWTLTSRFRRLVIGVRLGGLTTAAPTGWTLQLDDLAYPILDLTPSPLDPTLCHGLIEIDRAGAGPVTLTLEHSGPAPLEVRDLIVRPRGLGDDPIGDELLIEEGRYWSEHIAAYVAVGDEAVTDGRRPGTHPSFLAIGVRRPDTRDRHNRYGFYPDRVTRFLTAPLAARRGGVGVDLGTGCGQFALEAARSGLRMVGVDLGAGLLAIARNVALDRARSEGVCIDYLRAESTRLPLRGQAFDAVTVKESLHHLPRPELALDEARRVMRPGAVFVAAEHAASVPWLEALFVRTTLLFRPLILRRHPRYRVPEALTYPSPLEETGCNRIQPAIEERFARHRRIRRFIFVDHIQMHVHYAFGRWRWLVGPPLTALAWLVELWIEWRLGTPLSVCYVGEEEP